MKKIVIFIALLMQLSLHADAFKYEQEFTLTRYTTMEDVKKMAALFTEATKEVGTLKITNVKYLQEGDAYHAIFKCLVKEVDKDLMKANAVMWEKYLNKN
jgi:hypothetical protein